MDRDIKEIIKGDRECLWHHIKPHRLFDRQEQLIIVEGQGLKVKDIHGREYLDASSGGVWSVIVGYGRESIAEAVCDQLKKMPYFSGGFGNVPSILFAQKLLQHLPRLDKVYFSNSGSEANEKIFKMIRQAARLPGPQQGKYKILFRDRDYHGTTLGALSATGQPERRRHFGPLCEGFAGFAHALCFRCPFHKTYPGCDIDCALDLERVLLEQGPDTVGGVIVEPITAGGGIIVPVDEYYPLLQEICRKYGVLLIMDEVVCGFGRTGNFWGHEHYQVDPDAVTIAKGLASSYEPISATVVRQELYDLFLNDLDDPAQRLNFFRDISTYGGCAGGPAAALETARIIEDEDLVGNSRKMGAHLLDRLRELSDLPLVGDVRGRGLFAGVELVQDKATKEPLPEARMGQVMKDVMAQGVLVGRTYSSLADHNSIMNLAPALVATKEEVDRIVDAVEAALRKNC